MYAYIYLMDINKFGATHNVRNRKIIDYGQEIVYNIIPFGV